MEDQEKRFREALVRARNARDMLATVIWQFTERPCGKMPVEEFQKRLRESVAVATVEKRRLESYMADCVAPLCDAMRQCAERLSELITVAQAHIG